MIKIYLILSIIFFTSSCSYRNDLSSNNKNGNTYLLKGKIYGMDTGWLYIVHRDTTGKSDYSDLDSTKVTNTYFQFHGKLLNSEPCKIMFKNEEHLWPYTAFFILS
jgi:hypothetical protein